MSALGEACKRKNASSVIPKDLIALASVTSMDSSMQATSEVDLCLRPSDNHSIGEKEVSDDLSDAMPPVPGEEDNGSVNTDKRPSLPPHNSPNFFFNESMSVETALIMAHSEQEGSQQMDASVRSGRDVCRIVSARRPRLVGGEDMLKSSSDLVVYADARHEENVENIPLSRWSIPSLETSMVSLLGERAGVRIQHASGGGQLVLAPLRTPQCDMSPLIVQSCLSTRPPLSQARGGIQHTQNWSGLGCPLDHWC